MSDRPTTWIYTLKIQNNSHDPLSSGRKVCENQGCSERADHVAGDGTGIYFACDHCVLLIPASHLIHSNPSPP